MSARPRLLLIHGFLSGPSVWASAVEHLNGVAETVTVNLPGYGRARLTVGQEEYALERLVADFDSVLDSVRPTHIAGHSMGAIVALALAARHPGRFERVGLIGLPVFGSREEGLAHQRQRGLVFRAWLRNDRAAHASCRALHAVRWGWTPLRPWFAPGIPRAVLYDALDHSAAGHGPALERVVFAGLVPGLAAEAGGAEIAALHGEGDRAAPLERAEALAAEHGWDFTVVRGGKHQVMTRRPRRTARWIRERLLAPPDDADETRKGAGASQERARGGDCAT